MKTSLIKKWKEKVDEIEKAIKFFNANNSKPAYLHYLNGKYKGVKDCLDKQQIVNKRLIEDLGEPTPDNYYIISPDENGRWWIQHNAIETGEPLDQWLNKEIVYNESL